MSTTQAPRKLRDAELTALKASSRLNEEEIQSLFEKFQAMDESGTDKMNKEQVVKFYIEIGSDRGTDERIANNIFGIVDQDNDDLLNFSEFVLEPRGSGNPFQPPSIAGLKSPQLENSGLRGTSHLIEHQKIYRIMCAPSDGSKVSPR
ncbi:unnamed protein product [Adineta ricciae]|uniref:EF-hand domain-containing protein n=1 Tax=Adineta ricciae TaxID=249248 RepID=A0A815W141_ADIRI|nr:unnamed protein product [Adineta ricciae]